MLEQIKRLQCKLFDLTNAAYSSSAKDLDFIRIDNHYYDQLESISIDYAIMERLDNMILLEVDFKWNDLESWNFTWHISAKDEHNNYHLCDLLTKNVKNSFIISDNRLLL